MAASPSTGNYTLGRGIVTIGEWADDTTYPTVFTDMGNVTGFELELTEEKLDHYSSRAGLRVKDKSVTLEVGYNVSFTPDEDTYNNFLIYSKGAYTAPATGVDAFVEGLAATDKNYAVIFTTANAAGEDKVYKFYKVSLGPNGNLALIGDVWLEIPLIGEGLKVDDATLSGTDGEDPYSSYYVREEAGTAI